MYVNKYKVKGNMYNDRRGGGRSPRRFSGGGGRFTPPVRVGEELEVKIEAVGEKGDGIAKKDGFVLFIPGAKEGETVKIKVTKVFKKVGFAEIVGKGSEQPAESGNAEEAPREDFTEEAPQEVSTEDSEDFGEEAPAEEPQEEAPVEEAPEEEQPTEEEKPAEE